MKRQIVPASPGMKLCQFLKTERPLADFTPDPTRPDGLHAYCREGRAAYMRRHRARKEPAVVVPKPAVVAATPRQPVSLPTKGRAATYTTAPSPLRRRMEALAALKAEHS